MKKSDGYITGRRKYTQKEIFNIKMNSDENNKYRICYFCGRSSLQVNLDYYKYIYEGGVLQCVGKFDCHEEFKTHYDCVRNKKKRKKYRVDKLNESIKKLKKKDPSLF